MCCGSLIALKGKNIQPEDSVLEAAENSHMGFLMSVLGSI